MKLQFILAGCLVMMIGTLIFMYQAALNSSVVEVSVADQSSSSAQEAPAGRQSWVEAGESDDVNISSHQASAGL